ncbi:MAG: hypothetical protein ACRD11_17245 [Terriglobia bacterium]
MKIAVSIPDPIYASAERMSQRLRIPRSQLYAKAVEAFLTAHRGDRVTESLNAVYKHEISDLDPAVASPQDLSISHEDW